MDVVGICNAALDLVGAEHIQALDEESTQGELCAVQYPLVRDAVFGERNWRYATRRLELAADAAAPAYGYARRYQLPAGVVKVLEVSDGELLVEDWQREGEFILADQASPLFVRAVAIVEDPKLWHPAFAQAVITRLAAALAIPITENRSLHSDLWQVYTRHLHEAIAADGAQGVERPHTSAAISFVNRWRG